MKMHTASRALFLLLVSGFGWALWNRADFSAEALQHWAQSFGNAGPLVVIAAYALTTALFPPGAALAFVLASYGFMLPGVAAYSYVD